MFVFSLTTIYLFNVIHSSKPLANGEVPLDMSIDSYNALLKLLGAKPANYKGYLEDVRRVDIVFVIDASKNIGLDYFKCGLQALKDVALVLDSQNPLSSDGTNIGIARAAEDFNMELDLHVGKSLEKVYNSIDSVVYAGTKSLLSAGLRLAKRMLDRGGRKGAYKIVVILTDGKTQSKAMDDTVILLKKAGVEIYALPVTSTVDMNEIRSIVTEPYNEHVIEAVNYCTLDLAIVKLLPKND